MNTTYADTLYPRNNIDLPAYTLAQAMMQGYAYKEGWYLTDKPMEYLYRFIDRPDLIGLFFDAVARLRALLPPELYGEHWTQGEVINWVCLDFGEWVHQQESIGRGPGEPAWRAHLQDSVWDRVLPTNDTWTSEQQIVVPLLLGVPVNGFELALSHAVALLSGAGAKAAGVVPPHHRYWVLSGDTVPDPLATTFVHAAVEMTAYVPGEAAARAHAYVELAGRAQDIHRVYGVASGSVVLTGEVAPRQATIHPPLDRWEPHNPTITQGGLLPPYLR